MFTEIFTQIFKTEGLSMALTSILLLYVLTSSYEREKRFSRQVDKFNDTVNEQSDKFNNTVNEFRANNAEFKTSIDKLNITMEAMNRRMEKIEDKIDK